MRGIWSTLGQGDGSWDVNEGDCLSGILIENRSILSMWGLHGCCYLQRRLSVIEGSPSFSGSNDTA